MKQMFKFMNKMTKLIYEMAELKISNKMMEQELEKSVKKQDVLDCLFITNDNIFIKSSCENKLKKLLGVEDEVK